MDNDFRQIREADGKFRLGASGNPGGRPKAWRKFKEACREHTDEALKSLLQLGREDEDGRVRLAAWRTILEYGWGKPTQSVSIEDADGRPDPGVALALMQVIQGALPVEVLPSPDPGGVTDTEDAAPE